MDLNDYYAGRGAFNPTDTEYADGRLYVADGYSAGNYISMADHGQQLIDQVFWRKTRSPRV